MSKGFTKVIDGKRYEQLFHFNNKTNADKAASNMRKSGKYSSVRVVPQMDSGAGKKWKIWVVFFRR